MATKECMDCATEGRGKVVITQKDKRNADGSYWANADLSPHFFFLREQSGKPVFAHPRTSDEFNWCREHHGLNECPTYKTPFEKLSNKPDKDVNWKPNLSPGELETDIHKHVIADTNSLIRHFRSTAWELAKDLHPPDADVFSIRITACGFIHDAINIYNAHLIKQDLVELEKQVDSIMTQITKKKD